MHKRLLQSLFLFVIFAYPVLVKAQPVNDFQCNPVQLGTLPAAPLCTPSGPGYTIGMPVSQTGSTINATNDSLSGSISTCTAVTVLKDVWYNFIATESHVVVTLKGVGTAPLTDAYVGIYEAATNECVGLLPRACHASTGIPLDTFEFGPLAFGLHYYLQVASTSNTGAGAFSISVRSKNVCADCMKNSFLLAYPAPVQAAYPPDTTVGFCYSVVGYNEQYGNRLHGIVPLLGSGWDATTLTPVSLPASADGAGTWNWYNNISIDGSLQTGAFYNIGTDADPTNNVGDQGGFISVWTTCFTVKTQVKTLCDGGQTDLSIQFINYSDGESGSLVTPQTCAGDANYVFDAHMSCCQKPYGYTTAAGCNGSEDGALNAYGGSLSIFGYTYDLYNNDGIQIDNFSSVTAPYTNDSLDPGNYYLFVTDIQNNCRAGLNMYVPGPMIYTIAQTGYGCGSGCGNSAAVTITSGGAQTVSWNGGTGSGTSASGLCPGWNYVTIVDTGLVACTINDSVYIMNLPAASADFEYNQTYYCTADTFAEVTSFPVAAGGTFSLLSPSANTLDPYTGTVTLTASGTMYIKYQAPAPCLNTATDTIYVEISPAPVSLSAYVDHIICSGNPNPNFINTTSGNKIIWYDASMTAIGYQLPGTGFDPFLSASPAIGTYTFYVTQEDIAASSCESAPKQITIYIENSPAVSAGEDVATCAGFGVLLQATSSDPVNFVWSPSSLLNDAMVAAPLATITQNTLFYVVGTDLSSGCSASDSVNVFIDSLSSCGLVVYTGFTPNGDGNNDYWYIDGIGNDASNIVSVYNRWGEKIWEVTGYDNINRRWEGKSGNNGYLPDGTYYYLINFNNELLKGWVELTR